MLFAEASLAHSLIDNKKFRMIFSDPHLPWVIKQLLKVTASEASVKRLFRKQKEVQTPHGNRISRETLDAIMFTGINYDHMFSTEEDPPLGVEM